MNTGFKFRLRLLRLLAMLIGSIISAPFGGNIAFAAVITISASPLETIYSQTNTSGVGQVKINILPSATIYNSSLLNLSSDALITQLFALGPDNAASKIVDAFFVDSITSCGGPGANIVGCANRPGHDLVVKSSYAATDTAEVDLAHELGHNLGLSHVANPLSPPPGDNLMNPTLWGNTKLTDAQFATILLSPLFQRGDGDNDYFINIRPILVAASTPLPSTWAMMILGLGFIGFLLRRQSARTSIQSA